MWWAVAIIGTTAALAATVYLAAIVFAVIVTRMDDFHGESRGDISAHE